MPPQPKTVKKQQKLQLRKCKLVLVKCLHNFLIILFIFVVKLVRTLQTHGPQHHQKTSSRKHQHLHPVHERPAQNLYQIRRFHLQQAKNLNQKTPRYQMHQERNVNV